MTYDFDPNKPVEHLLDWNGRWLSVLEWGRLMQDYHYKRVGWTELDTYTISTVWDGMCAFMRMEAPDIFETMIFDKKGVGLVSWRHTTGKEALEFHNSLVAKLKEGADVERL